MIRKIYFPPLQKLYRERERNLEVNIVRKILCIKRVKLPSKTIQKKAQKKLDL
jgi:hypothetical protein